VTRSLSLVAGIAAAMLLAACPRGSDKSKPVEPPQGRGDAQQPVVTPPPSVDDAGLVALPPAPPLPALPQTLPQPPENPRVTAEAVAFGELLFHDPRMSADGARACASCHVPARGYSGDVDLAASGKPNLRRTPALVNLAWVSEYGWDGRARSLADHLPGHTKGQLDTLEASAARIAAVPVYRAHIARVGGTPEQAIAQALEAFVATRYEGDTPWDSLERTLRAKPGTPPTDPILAGYQVFVGKGQCAVCHVPPLYTDNGYHVVEREVLGDRGRGLVDPALVGAFRTPTLRGAMVRGSYFHSGNMRSIDDVIAHYQAAASQTGLDPALARVRLSADEAKQLVMFLNMLTINRPRADKPALP
jgi:cytochrome c peroxidase